MPNLRTDGGHLALDGRRVEYWVQPSQDRAAIVANQADLDTRRTGSKLCAICFSSVCRDMFAQRRAVKSMASAEAEEAHFEQARVPEDSVLGGGPDLDARARHRQA